MNRKQRQHIIVLAGVMLLVIVRLVAASDPLYQATQSLSLSLSRLVTPLTWQQTDEIVSQETVITQDEQSELALLRSELGLTETAYQTQAADVIKRDVSGYRKVIWINVGTQSGIAVNDAVLSSGILVGKIRFTSSDWSEVLLINDPQFRVSVVSGSVHGLLTNRGGSIFFDLAPEQLSEGSVVTSDGVDGMIPPGLPIGQVGLVATSPGETFNTYSLRLGVNPLTVRYIDVVVGLRS